MAKKIPSHRFNLEFMASVILVVSFFRPWLYSLGAPIAGYQIRERLMGPAKLVSFFNNHNDLVRDYQISWCLYLVPALACLTIIASFTRLYHAMLGLATGIASILAFFFLKHELDKFPLHRLASGAYLALWMGIFLIFISWLRLKFRKN